MNAVIEHMSAEGKDPGEKAFDEPGHPHEKQHRPQALAETIPNPLPMKSDR